MKWGGGGGDGMIFAKKSQNLEKKKSFYFN